MASKRSSAALVVLCACGGAGAETKAVEHPVDDSEDRAAHHAEEEEPDDGLELQSTRGKLDGDDVIAGIEPHAQVMQDCFLSRAGKQKWLGGKVDIKWELAADGVLTSAQIASSDLGSWPAEKCLLDEARLIAFGKPKGGDADFTVPFEFSAARGASWWDEEKAASVLGKHLADLDGCATSAKTADPTDVSVTLYVGTRGKVQSVGFASPALITDAWAGCAEKKVLAWQLSDPKGQVVKLGFVYRQGETPVSEEDGE
jgi:hypothetical protein